MSKQDQYFNSKIEWISQFQHLILAIFIGIDLMIVLLGATGRLNLFYPKPFPLEWADIPTRVFIMGSSPGTADAHLDEFPQHQVYLTAYQINRYLITNKQYLQCVQAGICE